MSGQVLASGACYDELQHGETIWKLMVSGSLQAMLCVGRKLCSNTCGPEDAALTNIVFTLLFSLLLPLPISMP